MALPICHIVGAAPGPIPRIPCDPGDLLLAADGGYAALARQGLCPDCTVGDLDSLGAQPTQGELRRLPVRKDDTDLAAAMAEGERRGFRRFFLYGALGGRFDHSLANCQLLGALAARGEEGWLFAENDSLTAISGSRLCIPAGQEGYVSVFSLTDRSEGVTERGLSYTVSEATFVNDRPLGVSNAFIPGTSAEIAVRRGVLLISLAGISPELAKKCVIEALK